MNVGVETYNESSIDLQDVINVGVAGAAIIDGGPLAVALGAGSIVLSVYSDELPGWADEFVVLEWGDEEATVDNARDLYYPEETTVDIYGY